MSNQTAKTNEDRLLELFIENYISKTQYFEMLERIKNNK